MPQVRGAWKHLEIKHICCTSGAAASLGQPQEHQLQKRPRTWPLGWRESVCPGATEQAAKRGPPLLPVPHPPPKKKSCCVFSHDHTAFYTILSGTGYIHTQCISHATASGDQGYALFEYYPVGTPETVEHNETSFLMETQPTELQIFSFSRHRFVFPLSFLIPENNQG